MIRDDVKIIVTPTGVSLKEALTKEVVKALDKEASIYMNYEIPEVKLGGNPPSGKESRFPAQLLSVGCSAKLKTEQRPALRQACGKD